jgi:hypothetical protein
MPKIKYEIDELDATIKVKRNDLYGFRSIGSLNIRRGRGRPRKNPGQSTLILDPVITDSRFINKFEPLSQDNRDTSMLSDGADMSYLSPTKEKRGALDITVSQLS